MSIWQDTLHSSFQELADSYLIRSLKSRASRNDALVNVDGKNQLAFASNDYLGLSFHPDIIAAFHQGSLEYGTGSGASSLISGHTLLHEDLEKRLALTQAHHIPNAKASFISTGFMANIAVITALAALGSVSIFSDALNHASIIDAIRLAKASSKSTCYIYRHTDYDHLKELLQGDLNPLKLIVSDGVFSMDGDIVDLPKLLEIAKGHDAMVYIDDAHGFGVLGKRGHGILDHHDIQSNQLIYMGTLGKAAGVAGAFVVADQDWIRWFIQKARPIIFSTAPPPNQALALLKSIELITGEQGQQKRYHLQNLISYWRKNAVFKSWQTLPSDTAIQPVVIGSNAKVLEVSQFLSANNIWVPAIRPPTVPVNTGRLRIALNVLHEFEHLDRLIYALRNAQ